MIHIGMTLYNKAPYVAQAIQSVINQTFTDWHLTILNNASTDSSLAVAREFRDPRIALVMGQQNLGQAAGLKHIFDDHAKTATHICWLDADDWLHPDCLKLSYEAKQPFVYTSYADVDESGLLLNLGYRNEIPHSNNTSLVNFTLHHFRLIEKSLYDKVGGVNPIFKQAEDYDLTLRLEEQTTPYKILSEPLYFYRQYLESDGAKNRQDQTDWAAKAVNAAIVRRGFSDKITLHEGPPFSIRFQ